MKTLNGWQLSTGLRRGYRALINRARALREPGAPTSRPGKIAFLGAVFVALAALAAAPRAAAQTPSNPDLALNKSVTVSSTQQGLPKEYAVDGDDTTRWSSDWNDGEWIYVDLGASTAIKKVSLKWENAYASSYKIQVSDNPTATPPVWTDAGANTSGHVGREDVIVNGTGRYVRVLCVTRGSGYGISLLDFQVFNSAGLTPSTDLAKGKTTTASSVQDNAAGYQPNMATDGDAVNTRWSSAATDPQWIMVNLGQPYELGQVSLVWEGGAYGKDFVIQGSNSPTANFVDLVSIQGGQGGRQNLQIPAGSGSFQYVRMNGTARGTGWGYSLYSFEVYGPGGGIAPPAQTGNQTVLLTFPSAGLAYGKVDSTPAPLSISPDDSPDGPGNLSVRNLLQPKTLRVTYPPNTTVTLKVNANSTLTDSGSTAVMTTTDYTGQKLTGASVLALAYNNQNWNYQVNAPAGGGGGGGGSDHPPANWINDPYAAPAALPVVGAFRLSAPANNAMVTSTRTPTLTWTASPGAVKYDVYLNISRTDYDWNAPGSLLDRYTKMTTVTAGTSYTLPDELPDRWTYKWCVVATDGSGVTSRSDVNTFSLYRPTLTAVADGINVINGCRDLNKNGVIDPYEDWHNPPAVRTADLMSRMSLHQKAMQLFFNTQLYPEAGFGFGPFDPKDLLAHQKDATATALGIPNIVLGDTIHGYKTVYPTQPGLAATRDLNLAWAVSDVHRSEELAVGARGTLSPLAEVDTKVLYPRIQEGNGEDADLAAAMVRAMVVGLQGGPEVNPKSLMITTKHWPGEGAGGESGVVYDGTTIWYHMRPWHAAIEAGTSSIMPGYGGSWLLNTANLGGGDDPGILDFLRNPGPTAYRSVNGLGYQGVIITDWLPSGAWTRACTNGADVMGGADPAQMGTFETDVPIARLDDAVRRVLDLKFRMGIFEDPYGTNLAGTYQWHTNEKVSVVHQAAQKSFTLLKNNGALPIRLPSGGSIVVDGPRADDPSCMVTWRSDFHEMDFNSKTFYKAIKERAVADGLAVYAPGARTPVPIPSGVTPGAAIVVVGETYFTHGTIWDKNSPWLPDDPIGAAHDTKDAPQYATIQKYKSMGIPVTVVVVSPRPYLLANVNQLADALALVYRPGDEGGPAVAETLFGDSLPQGRTPWQLPAAQSQFGVDEAPSYLRLGQPDRWDLPYDLGATTEALTAIKAAMGAGQHVDPIYGSPLYQFGSGIQGYGLVDGTPPLAFNLLTPTNGQAVGSILPTFTWQASSDPESGIHHYEVFIDNTLVGTVEDATSYTLKDAAIANGPHTWFVKATNWANGATVAPTFSFNVNDTTAPSAFTALLPASNTAVPGNPVAFYWAQSTDAGTGVASYTLLLDGAPVTSVGPTPYVSPTTNLALGKVASASSSTGNAPRNAVDGEATVTRWESVYDNPTLEPNPSAAWFQVDLGAVTLVNHVNIKWEAAYAKAYKIQVSVDGNVWRDIYVKSGGTGGTEDITTASGLVPAPGRYVRMQGVERPGTFGYSIYEFRVYGQGTEKAVQTLSPGGHTWQVRAMDGAGNTTTNSNGILSFTH